MVGEQDRSSIAHEGVVKEVTGSTVKVSLLNVANCAACHAKAGCGVSAVDTKVVEVVDTTGSFIKGEQVKVSLEHRIGARALLLGYILPFVVLFLSSLSGNDIDIPYCHDGFDKIYQKRLAWMEIE